MQVASSKKWYRPGLAAGVALMVLAAVVPGARAEVTDIRASTSAVVEQTVAGEPGSTDTSVESFPDTSPSLPMEVFAGLGNYTGQTEELHGARALARFTDPTLSALANPGEFGVEAECYAVEAGISYEVVAEASEVRDVVLSSAELDLPGGGQEALVASTVFLEGAVLVWTDQPERDLSNLVAEFDFNVVQETGTNGEEVVFEATLAVEGLAGGEVGLSHSSVLSAVLGRPDLLLATGGPSVTELVGQLEDIGKVHLVIIRRQEIDYVYSVRADEPFRLRATVRARAVNLPGGTGVAAVFGQPFSALAGAINPVLAKRSGDAVQAEINRAIREGNVPAGQRMLRSPVCGAFGGEVALLGLVGLVRLRGRSGHDR